MKFEPKEITFEKQAFEDATAKHKLYVSDLRELSEIASKYVSTNIEFSTIDYALDTFLKALAKHYATENVMNLNIYKFLDLKEISISNFENKLKTITPTERPNKEDYQTFTSSIRENEKLALAKNLLKVATNPKLVRQTVTNLNMFNQAFIIPPFVGRSGIQINPKFVKS